MAHTTKEFRRVLRRELKLIFKEALDGCLNCRKGSVCNTHNKLVADLAQSPKKYVEMVCVNGEWKSKRLTEV